MKVRMISGYKVTKLVADDGYVTWDIVAPNGQRGRVEYLREARECVKTHSMYGTWRRYLCTKEPMPISEWVKLSASV